MSMDFIEDFFNVGQKVYIIIDIISSNMNYVIVWFFFLIMSSSQHLESFYIYHPESS